MKVLLINPSTGYYNRALFNPLGMLSIGSHLKRIGHEVKLVDRCVELSNIHKLLDDFKPDILGVSLMSSRGLKDALKISKVAHNRGIPVAWGGAMPSIQINECMECEYVDYVMYSEGEFTFEELLEVLEGKRDKSTVLSLCYKENGKIIRNPDRPFADLKDMPISDFSLIDPEKYMQEYLGCKRMMYLYSSKGCPYNCAFCTNKCFHRCQHRKRPNEYVIEEIKYLVDNYGLDGVYFSDEQWVIRKEDAWDFCRQLEENDIHIHFGIQTRIGIFSKEDFQRMYDAGLRWALFGIETGSESVKKRINKQIDYNKVVPTFEALREIGITSVATFIIGYPGETVEEVRDTVHMQMNCPANLTPVFHFNPFPGTKLYDEVMEKGTYKPPKSLKELGKYIPIETIDQNVSNVPTRDLKVIRNCANWRAFSKKDAIQNDKPFEFAINTIKSGLHAISQKGPIFFMIDGFTALREFTYTFWYSHAYPKIRKKYDIEL